MNADKKTSADFKACRKFLVPKPGLGNEELKVSDKKNGGHYYV